MLKEHGVSDIIKLTDVVEIDHVQDMKIERSVQTCTVKRNTDMTGYTRKDSGTL